MINVAHTACKLPRRMTWLGFSLPSLIRAGAGQQHPKMTERRKVLVITGPTAVGKSATALKLCKLLDGEIITADSVQVYKHLDIGSNKASPEEQAEVRHHMLDIADPSVDTLSAGDFFRAARITIEDVHSRNRLPVVVGGTMMYVRWLIYGRPATPRAPDDARERAEEIVKGLGGNWDAGIALLAQRDPKRAEMLSPNDWYRLGRAFEVLETTGVAMTDLPLQGGAPNADVDVDMLDYDFRCVFLFGERRSLSRRIDERCEEMILPRNDVVDESGSEHVFQRSVLTEVSTLLRADGLRVAPASPSRAIGYRQTILYLVGRSLALQATEGHAPSNAESSEIAVQEFRKFVKNFQAATRGYAKQQTSWFRKEKQFRWVRAGADAVMEIQGLMGLSDLEYQELQRETAEEQMQLRQDMIAQGKLMKTYIGKKLWLQEGSLPERQAVRLAERSARAMAQTMRTEELERIREVLIG